MQNHKTIFCVLCLTGVNNVMDFIQIKLQDFVFDKQLLDGKRRGCMMTITSVQQRYLILKQLNDAVVL